MKQENQCPSCGASNDPIFTNCMFCETRLPFKDINSIDEEELLSNCVKWVSKFETLVIDPDLLATAKQKDKLANNPMGKLMELGMTKDSISLSKIKSTTEKYLNLFEVKSQNSPSLKQKVSDLRKRYTAATNEIKVSEDKMKKKTAYLIFGSVIFIVVMLFASNIGSSSHDDAVEKEKQRLENIMTQINTALFEKNYVYAEVLCSQLKWEHFDSYTSRDTDKLAKKWDEKREEMLNTIIEVQNRKE